MIPFEQIKTTVTSMRANLQASKAIAANLHDTLARLDDGTRSKEFLADQTRGHREHFGGQILEHLGAAKTSASMVLASEKMWLSKDYVMSTRPLTKTLNGHPFAPAADATAEALARVALMGELSKMSPTMLRLKGEAAKGLGQLGALYLVSLENGSRDPKSPGWEPIPLDDVVLEDQQQALDLLREAKAISMAIEHEWRTAAGTRPPSPAEKISLARMMPAEQEVAA